MQYRRLPGHRERQPEFLILFVEVRLVRAGQVMEDSIGLGILDLEEVGGKIGGSGGHEFAAQFHPIVLLEEITRYPKQVVTESVIGRDEVPAVELLILYEPVPDRTDVLRVTPFCRKYITMATVISNFIGIGTRVDKDDFGSLHYISDGQGAGAAYGSLNSMNFILFDQLARFLHRHPGINFILHD